jgi:hypothetical protein
VGRGEVIKTGNTLDGKARLDRRLDIRSIVGAVLGGVLINLHSHLEGLFDPGYRAGYIEHQAIGSIVGDR